MCIYVEIKGKGANEEVRKREERKIREDEKKNRFEDGIAAINGLGNPVLA